MIVLPRLDEMQGGDWATEGTAGGSFLNGAAAPLPLGSFRLPDAPHLLASAPAPADDDPVKRADTMRERAGQVFQRQRAIGTFNRDLDGLFATIAEGTDWSEGLSKFDKESANLRAKHLASLRTPEDRAAFEQHADAFAAMQRIGLKRALTERQQADALALLDDQLAYYADKAAQAPNEVFHRMAIEAGERAIEELRDAGYLFPESADRRKQAFLGRIDGADLESIVRAYPDDAPGILDNPALFPNVDAATREKLRLRLLPAVRRPGDPPPEIRTADWRNHDDPTPQIAPFEAPADGEDAAEGDERTGLTDIDDIAEALAPLIEKDNGLGELVDAAQANPDDPGTLVRLAATLTEIGPTLPEANLGKLLEAVGRLIGPLGRFLRRDRPDDQPPQFPAPKQRGEEPSAPPAGSPSPISPPRAKPPTVPPPEQKIESAEADRQPHEPRWKRLAPPEDRYTSDGPEGLAKFEDGSTEFGHISADAAEVARTHGIKDAKEGVIVLERGFQDPHAPDRGMGAEHVRSNHERNIRAYKDGDGRPVYRDVEELVADVTANYNRIARGDKGRIVLGKANGKEKIVVVEIAPKGDGYTVITAGIRNKGWLDRPQRALPWRRTDPSSSPASGLPTSDRGTATDHRHGPSDPGGQGP